MIFQLKNSKKAKKTSNTVQDSQVKL